MKKERLNFFQKISQDITSSISGSYNQTQLDLMDEILKTITSPVPFLSEDIKFEPSAAKLANISEVVSVTTKEEVDAGLALLEELEVANADLGRQATQQLAQEASKANLSDQTLDHLKSACEKTFEKEFFKRMSNYVEEESLKIICADLKNHGVFRLYERRSISKIASRLYSQEIGCERNMELLRERFISYSSLRKDAQIWDALKSGVKGLISGTEKAVSAVGEYAGKALSGAWGVVKKLGKTFVKALPFLGIIWDIWDLCIHAHNAWSVWSVEFKKYESYGDPKKLSSIDYLNDLYESSRSDLSESGLKKILDIVNITKLSQAFDEHFVMGVTHVVLVIEDIAAFLINLIPYVGWLIDIAISLGILFYGRSVAEERRVQFNQLKDLIYNDINNARNNLSNEVGTQVSEEPQIGNDIPGSMIGQLGRVTKNLAETLPNPAKGLSSVL